MSALPPTASELSAKRAFAEALLRDPENPFRAALAACGQADIGRALWVSDLWPADAQVLEFQADLISEHGVEHFLPDKSALARAIWRLAESNIDADSKIKAYKLYGEVSGITKQSSNTNVTVNNKTMVVAHFDSPEDWQAAARKQQDRLIEEVRALE